MPLLLMLPFRASPQNSWTRDSTFLRGWPEPYTYGVITIIWAGKSPNIRSYQVYAYTVLANSTFLPYFTSAREANRRLTLIYCSLLRKSTTTNLLQKQWQPTTTFGSAQQQTDAPCSTRCRSPPTIWSVTMATLDHIW
jgi:hypothetical protein